MRLLTALLLVAVLCPAVNALAIDLSPEKLKFEYIGLFDPYPTGACTHALTDAASSPYDWTVNCTVDGRPHRYSVHLSVDFYPKTVQGVASYEVLYWVTDLSKPTPGHTSSTTWIHNSNPDNRMNFLEVSQGIEDDAAYLKIEIDPKS